jgi:Zn-dependent M28 family amino/carboxypeptidase
MAEELRGMVEVLSDATGGVGRAGNRSTFYPKRFAESAAWLRDQLAAAGFAEIEEVFVERGSPVPNMIVTVPGTSRAPEIVVVGAHLDAFQGTPGADDNASGVAGTLVLARRFLREPQARTLRFAFFVNEEPPAFWTADMGSWVYAKACRARGDNIIAMISLESIGYYSDKPGSQRYPAPLNLLYSDRGDFIAFVSNWSSRALNKRAIRVFRDSVSFPSEGGSPPGFLPGVGWSDHWSFWQEGYRAIMITDTAAFRNPNYHTPQDKWDTLDYDRMSRVVEGVEAVVRDLAGE